MRATVLSCEVFERELRHIAGELPHEYTFHFEPFGLHNTPDQLANHLQTIVDDATDADVVILGYGLCSRGIVGLTARDVPIVAPRAHDCMTLFLGSRERYDEEFGRHPGTYYYSPGWVDRYDPVTKLEQFGMLEERFNEARSAKFEAYVEKYGEDNAQYLMAVEAQWQENYTRTVYIHTGVGVGDEYRAFVRRLADERGWEYGEIAGDMTLMHRLLAGD